MSTRTWFESKKNFLPSSRSTPSTTSSVTSVIQQQHQLHIGDRVQINQLHGTIRYIGPTKFKAGTWAGIELDTVGLGKNDGSVEG